MEWQEKMNSVDDVQCFTIREIEGVIKALTQNRNIYDTIMTIYGARYQKKIKNQLKEQLQKYRTLRDLQPSPLSLPKEFPHCFSNYNLCEACEQLNSEIEFHPHKDFILIRIPESAEMNDGYSYECLTNNLEIHQNYGIDSFNYKIKLQNTGNQLWPEKQSILKCRKELSTIFCKNCELPPIDINETTEVNLFFDKCNKIPRGEYMAYIQFYIKGKIIRGPIRIKVFIE
jgi:hypothetical protein